MISAGAAFAGENVINHCGVEAGCPHHVGSSQVMGFHTVEQIVGQRACADESLIRDTAQCWRWRAADPTVPRSNVLRGCLPLPMLLVAVLRVLCCAIVRGCSIPSVQDADFSETRRKIQLSADVWPARVADNGRCHPCRCGGGKDVHARYQASTIKLTCIQNANLRT